MQEIDLCKERHTSHSGSGRYDSKLQQSVPTDTVVDETSERKSHLCPSGYPRSL